MTSAPTHRRTAATRAATAAAAGLLVVLALASCGRVAERPDHGVGTPASQAATTAPGASSVTTSPASAPPREDGPTPTATGPVATDLAELQQALDAADKLADEVDQDIASDGS